MEHQYELNLALLGTPANTGPKILLDTHKDADQGCARFEGLRHNGDQNHGQGEQQAVLEGNKLQEGDLTQLSLRRVWVHQSNVHEPLRLIPMILQLSTQKMESFVYYLKVDLYSKYPVLELVYAKNTELTYRDSQNIQTLFDIIRAIPKCPHRKVFFRGIIHHLATYSTHKLALFFGEIRLNAGRILAHIRQMKKLSSDLDVSGMSLLNPEQVIQRMKAGSPTEMLELALDMVDECQEVNPQFWRVEGLESLLLFARQLGEEPKFWELGKYSSDLELQQCYSKFQWLIGLLGGYAKFSDKCYDFFGGRHGLFLSYLRSVPVEEPNKDRVVRLCSVLMNQMDLAKNVKWQTIPPRSWAVMKLFQDRHSWIGNYLDKVSRRAGIYLTCRWIHLLEAEIKLGLHACEEREVRYVCTSAENLYTFPDGGTADIIDRSWGEVFPPLPSSFNGDVSHSTVPLVSYRLDKAIWESVRAIREENKFLVRETASFSPREIGRFDSAFADFAYEESDTDDY